VTAESGTAPQTTLDTTRRGALTGLGVAGVAVVVAACGGGSSGSSDSSSGDSSALGSTSEIPVGGGKIFTDEKVVVTQPTAGEFKGFSAICTHMGCTVDKIADGTIDCPCHGSKFAIADGSVVNGPAQRSLAGHEVTVSGDGLYLQS
jgi:nitrite reductase/ring-hydroxylating ferredoxin subunit